MADDAHRERYAREIESARAAGADAFQAWFDNAESEDAAFQRGQWDFSIHVLTPGVVAHFTQPRTALEIGCGGGRLLAAAAGYFDQVIGIDVHHELDTVANTMMRRGHANVMLLPTDGSTIPVPDEAIDFVYSFIVLQHVPRFETFLRYLHETHRVLGEHGVAQLYFGRQQTRNPLRHWRELDAPVNHVSLEVSPRYARRVARSLGFSVVETGTSYKRVPAGYPAVRGGQSFLTLVKR